MRVAPTLGPAEKGGPYLWQVSVTLTKHEAQQLIELLPEGDLRTEIQTTLARIASWGHPQRPSSKG